MSAIEDVRVEMYLGAWTDVTGDVRQDPGVSVTRARPNEGTKITTPGTCGFNLKNGADASGGAGTYDPRWPLSPYYGVLGKGVPVRVGLRRAGDAFGRTVASGWGTADLGGTWSNVVAGTTSGAVSGGKGTHTVSGTSAFRLSYLTSFSQRDVDVKVTFSLPFTNVTGGAVEPGNIVLRYVDASNYNLVRVSIDTAEAITLTFTSIVAGVETVESSTGDFVGTTATGLTHSSAQSVTVRAVTEGTVTRAKIWAAGTPEPLDWLWYCRTNANYGPGSVGVRSGVAAGNTNVPVTFSYDDFEVMAPRFYGEVSALTQKQEKSGKERWVEVEAADLFRRLQTGASPVQSTLRRGIPGLADLVAYWPMEDGADAATGAAVVGTSPMEVTQGAVTWASYDGFDGSDKIPVPDNGTLHVTVPPHTVGYEMVRFLTHVPASGIVDDDAVCTIHTAGTIARWRLALSATGGLNLQWFSSPAVVFVGQTGAIAFNMLDREVMLSIELRQNGTGIDWSIVTVEPGATTGSAASGTVATQTLGSITDVYLTPDVNVQNTAFGHLHIQRAFHSIFAIGPQLRGWRNELARNRVARIAVENGLAARSYRSPQTPDEPSTLMGPQGIKTVVELLEDTAQADLALIAPMKSSGLLQYRTHPSMQGQDPRATIDVAAHQLGAPPLPTDDNQVLTNDVTAKRTEGSSYRAVLTSGKNSTASPSAGGIGTYDSSDTYNVYSETYLPDIANWKLALGTYDGPRYPQLTVLRHGPEVVADTALSAALLDVDAGDVLMIENLPLGDDRAMVFGYRETITRFEHTIVFNCGPGNLWNIAITDDADSRVDSDNSTLAASLTTTATSVSVIVASGYALWMDSATFASQFPVDVLIGGEQMTVTAITANLLTDPGFEVGIVDWFFNGATGTQSTVQKHSGTFALRMVPDGVTSSVYAQSPLAPVLTGESVTVSAWVWFTSAVSSNYATAINWFDANQAYLSTSLTAVSVSAATWTQVAATFTAPANARYAAIVPLLGGTPAAAQVWYVDDVSITVPSRQLFTVTRSVNGIVKAHAAGESVHLADPVYVGAGIQT